METFLPFAGFLFSYQWQPPRGSKKRKRDDQYSCFLLSQAIQQETIIHGRLARESNEKRDDGGSEEKQDLPSMVAPAQFWEGYGKQFFNPGKTIGSF